MPGKRFEGSMHDDIKRGIMIEPSTKMERNPKFKVGEIVYRINSNDTEEFLVVTVGINIEELMKNERVEFWYSIIAKPIEESPAVRELRKLQGVPYSLLTHEIRVKEEDLIGDVGELIRGQIRKYEYKQAEIEKKICELKVKLEEKGMPYENI